MKILCIGGGGFLGSNFNQFIDDNNYGEVKNLDNGSLSTNKVKYIKFDVCNNTIESLCDYLNNADVIINFAAITRVEDSIINPFKSFQTNTLIHQKICEALRSLKNVSGKKPILVLISTGGAIAGDSIKLINEKILPKPISVYGASKLACEAMSFSYYKSYKLDIRNLRLTNVYGPFSEKKESVIARFIKLIISNKTIYVRGNGDMKRDFIHTNDVNKAIYKMILNGKPGQTVQIGSGSSTSINDIVNLLKVFEPNLHHTNVPKIKGEVDTVKCDISYAKKTLNWEPMEEFDEGLRKTWNYFKNNQLLI